MCVHCSCSCTSCISTFASHLSQPRNLPTNGAAGRKVLARLWLVQHHDVAALADIGKVKMPGNVYIWQRSCHQAFE